jgi:Tfp pilus assembly protein PilN
MQTNSKHLLDNLDEIQLEFVEKYQEILNRVKVLQTRMALLESEINLATKELQDLRELEQKTSQRNGKRQ